LAVSLAAGPRLALAQGAQAVRPPLMLAGVYRTAYPLDEAWVSEKYDGVRAYWDGHALWTRGGQRIAAPGWFTAGWPATPMDGELWAGRGQFEAALSTVRQQVPQDAAWRAVRYMVFDMPAHGGVFSARRLALQATVQALGQPWVQAVEHKPVASATSLQALLKRTVAEGGEGLVLQQASGLYLPGRSTTLVKLKPFEDAEGQVLSHVPGQGRLQGRMGAVWLEMPAPDGGKPLRFKLGSGFTDAQRQDPPAVGSWVSFRFRGYTEQGVPRFASYLRPAQAPDS
jgi:DNA ligase-1